MQSFKDRTAGAAEGFPDPRDPFVRHEALDRAALIASTFEREVLGHPAVQADVVLKSIAESAMRSLSDLYQAAAQDPA